MNRPTFLSRFNPAQLLAPVCRRSFFDGLIGPEMPAQYRVLTGPFPFRHPCNLSLQPAALRIGSSRLRVGLQLGPACHVHREGANQVAVYGAGKDAFTLCHFRNGKLAMVQQVIADHRAATAALALLEQAYNLRLPAQEEDFLLFNAAGERLVVRRDHSLQLFYMGSAHSLIEMQPAQRPVKRGRPEPQLAWVS